jgi:Rps23 Pro-64 3,4-dihydroxylase Tpa1-like proline 4-hydroxylase
MIEAARPTAPVMILDEFLSAEEWRQLLDFTFSRADQFQPTQVITDGDDRLNHDARRSVVMFEPEWVRELFAERLMTFYPQILTGLGHPWFEVTRIETQLTGTSDGEFFRSHTDNGSAAVAERTITFVYCFYREPRRFSGGELRIHDTVFENGGVRNAGPFRDGSPLQNQMILFPSGYLHEILPVSSPSDAFVDRRFTVNGWLYR